MLKAPVASMSAMVSSEWRPARSAASARSRSTGPSARTFSRIVASLTALASVAASRASREHLTPRDDAERRADPLDLDLDSVALAHEDRRLARVADA